MNNLGEAIFYQWGIYDFIKLSNLNIQLHGFWWIYTPNDSETFISTEEGKIFSFKFTIQISVTGVNEFWPVVEEIQWD